jgi:hypothetical protein
MFYGLERLLITNGDAEGIPGQIRERAPISRNLAISRKLAICRAL